MCYTSVLQGNGLTNVLAPYSQMCGLVSSLSGSKQESLMISSIRFVHDVNKQGQQHSIPQIIPSCSFSTVCLVLSLDPSLAHSVLYLYITSVSPTPHGLKLNTNTWACLCFSPRNKVERNCNDNKAPFDFSLYLFSSLLYLCVLFTRLQTSLWFVSWALISSPLMTSPWMWTP